jgi:hypothetical protein
MQAALISASKETGPTTPRRDPAAPSHHSSGVCESCWIGPLGAVARVVFSVPLVTRLAAIANGVHHATGRRIRSSPITLDEFL